MYRVKSKEISLNIFLEIISDFHLDKFIIGDNSNYCSEIFYSAICHGIFYF